ncbi:MAG: ion transporter [Spirochaetales bacterium]|nr:ion transporter [Spirochaetales bacterium]
MIRKRIYEIIEQGRNGDRISIAYDVVMLIAIAVSIIPLMFVEDTRAFRIIEQITVSLFILDYLLRWITADYRLERGGWSFVLYPFTGWAIIDLLSILPGFTMLGKGFKILRITRLLRILRLFKFIRYSDKIQVLGRVVRKEKGVLLTVLGIAVFYVFLTALIMFNAEPHINPVTGNVTFEDFFDALYWATVTLTTVGYGDMIPVTDIGRFVSMLSSLFGVAVIALPSGVITASYLEELRSLKDENTTEEGKK